MVGLRAVKTWLIRHGLWDCTHDWVWMHDTPAKQLAFGEDHQAWFDDYPNSPYPDAYRCSVCGAQR